MSDIRNKTSVSFQATRNGIRKPHVEHCFLHRFHVDPLAMPLKMKISNGLTYDLHYERFTESSSREAIEVIGSFQKWIDGTCIAVIRPYQPTVGETMAKQLKELENVK